MTKTKKKQNWSNQLKSRTADIRILSAYTKAKIETMNESRDESK